MELVVLQQQMHEYEVFNMSSVETQQIVQVVVRVADGEAQQVLLLVA